MQNKTINVLITGLGGGGFGEQCMQALRLSDLNCKIIGTDMNSLGAGLFMSDIGYLVPSSNDKNYIATIFNICGKEKINVLIPGSEPELKKISECRGKFEEIGIEVLINNQKVIDTCLDKWETYCFLKSNGFLIPKTYLIKKKGKNNIDCQYPIIIKPYRGSGGSKNIFLAQNKEELIFFVKYLNKQKLSIIAQEYVGSSEEEFTVGVLSDKKGNLIGSIALKRIIKSSLSKFFSVKDQKSGEEYVISSGVSQGKIDKYEKIRINAEKIAKKIGSTGPLNIQCRLTPRGIYTFEINPRFSGTTSIRALCGFNEPDLLIKKYILKEKIKKVHYKKGLILRGLFNYYISEQRQNTLNKNKFIKNK